MLALLPRELPPKVTLNEPLPASAIVPPPPAIMHTDSSDDAMVAVTDAELAGQNIRTPPPDNVIGPVPNGVIEPVLNVENCVLASVPLLTKLAPLRLLVLRSVNVPSPLLAIPPTPSIGADTSRSPPLVLIARSSELRGDGICHEFGFQLGLASIATGIDQALALTRTASMPCVGPSLSVITSQ